MDRGRSVDSIGARIEELWGESRVGAETWESEGEEGGKMMRI